MFRGRKIKTQKAFACGQKGEIIERGVWREWESAMNVGEQFDRGLHKNYARQWLWGWSSSAY